MQKIDCEQLRSEVKSIAKQAANFLKALKQEGIKETNFKDFARSKNNLLNGFSLLSDMIVAADEYLIFKDYIDILSEAGVCKNLAQVEAWCEKFAISIDRQSRRLVADCDFSDFLIDRLPRNLTVKGSLNLTNLAKIPDGLIIGGHLNIRSLLVKELPENLSVGGDIIVDSKNKKLKKQAKNLKKKGLIKGDVITF